MSRTQCATQPAPRLMSSQSGLISVVTEAPDPPHSRTAVPSWQEDHSALDACRLRVLRVNRGRGTALDISAKNPAKPMQTGNAMVTTEVRTVLKWRSMLPASPCTAAAKTGELACHGSRYWGYWIRQSAPSLQR